MRIATWNLAGRWSPEHRALVDRWDCDVLLLTEVSERVELEEYDAVRTVAFMAPKRRWAAVFSRIGLSPLPDPHPASALATVGARTFCSSILPWKGARGSAPWVEGNHAAKTSRTVADLLDVLPRSHLVWGGDWNHALHGREYAGSMAGRASISSALVELGLEVPTATLPHQIESLLSIDHIAVPVGADVRGVAHVSALTATGRLSDHDAYVVELREGERP